MVSGVEGAEYRVRLTGPDDWMMLADFLEQQGVFDDKRDGVQLPFSTNPRVIAERIADGAIVGHADPGLADERNPLVRSVVVAESARGKGVGPAVMELVIAVASARCSGNRTIEVQVNGDAPGAEELIAWYENKVGLEKFYEGVVGLKLDLPPSEPDLVSAMRRIKRTGGRHVKVYSEGAVAALRRALAASNAKDLQDVAAVLDDDPTGLAVTFTPWFPSANYPSKVVRLGSVLSGGDMVLVRGMRADRADRPKVGDGGEAIDSYGWYLLAFDTHKRREILVFNVRPDGREAKVLWGRPEQAALADLGKAALAL